MSVPLGIHLLILTFSCSSVYWTTLSCAVSGIYDQELSSKNLFRKEFQEHFADLK